MSGHPSFVRAFAPGTIGNVGPGFDLLGLAVTGPGDWVAASFCDGTEVVISDPGHPDLPRQAELNAAGIAALAVLARAGARGRGIELRIEKGLPLAGGQGGSAASAVAGAVATNALLGAGLSEAQLIEAAMAAESQVAGRHFDNVLPALLGGLVLIRSAAPLDYVRLPLPRSLFVVLAHPELRLRTADARAVLPRQVPREVAVHQAAQVAALVTALSTSDFALLGRAIDDRIAEPVRAPLIKGFVEAKQAALAAGAAGCSISGSGPTVFAFARDAESAAVVAAAMVAGFGQQHVACTARVERANSRGAYVEMTGA